MSGSSHCVDPVAEEIGDGVRPVADGAVGMTRHNPLEGVGQIRERGIQIAVAPDERVHTIESFDHASPAARRASSMS